MAPRGIADKRSAILRAAARLFGAGQFHGTTIPVLAREAGVAEGTIYNYFENKEDVAFVALVEASAAYERDIVSIVPQRAPPFEQLTYAAALILQLAEDDLETARFLLRADHASYLGARAADANSLPQLFGLMLANATARGSTKPLPGDLLVSLWLGVVRAAVEARADGRIGQPLPSVADTVARAAVDAIRA